MRLYHTASHFHQRSLMFNNIALSIKVWFSIRRLIGTIILIILACLLFGLMISIYGVLTVVITTLICLVGCSLLYLGIRLII